MGKLNEQGLQRLVGNIKKDIDGKTEVIKGDIEVLRNNVSSLDASVLQQREDITAIQRELGINKETLITNTIEIFNLY